MSHLTKSQPFDWVQAVWLSSSQFFGIPAIWLPPNKLLFSCLIYIWLSSSHLAGIQRKNLIGRLDLWLASHSAFGWLGFWPSQPNVAGKIYKWLETCCHRFHDCTTLSVLNIQKALLQRSYLSKTGNCHVFWKLTELVINDHNLYHIIKYICFWAQKQQNMQYNKKKIYIYIYIEEEKMDAVGL